MTPFQKIRTSFTTQLSMWVAGFVVVISGLVIFLLASFSEDVILDETIDTTMQALENTALRMDNAMRQREMTARLEHQQMRMNRSRIENLIEENGALTTLRKTLPNIQLYVTRRDSSQFDAFITGGESGYRQLMYDDKEIYLFSQPLGNRPFCLVAVSPAEDIYSRFSRMQWLLLTLGVGAILVLIYILYVAIGHHLHPLHRLADSAQAIADGALDTPIADTRHQDETGRLQNSLSMMQRRLAAYMAEMKHKQDKLNRQNAELQAAYDEAQAYEQKKTKFMHEMNERMTAPVELLCRSTETICREYHTLSNADMTALQADIMKGSETVTELLDELIKDTAGS